MRKELFISSIMICACISAYASDSINENCATKTARKIKVVSDAASNAENICVDITDKCIKTTGLGIKIAIALADFLSRFNSKI